MYSTNVRLAGVNLHFVSDMEVDIIHLHQLFKYHLATDEDVMGNSSHLIEIKTVTKQRVPASASLVWQGNYHGVGHKGHHDNRLKKYLSADGKTEYFMASEGSCIINDLTANRTICTLQVKRHWLTRRGVRATVGLVIILLIHIIMTRHRRYAIHAAAVVWLGRTVVFTGRSGMGKSTLCTDLVAQGAGFLGDDIVFLYQENDEVRVASLLFDAKLYQQGKPLKGFVDVLECYGCTKMEDAPLQAFAKIVPTRKGFSTVQLVQDDNVLFDVLLTAANNIALQYDHDDWIALCTRVYENYRLYNFCFGDRTLLNVSILDEFYGKERNTGYLESV